MKTKGLYFSVGAATLVAAALAGGAQDAMAQAYPAKNIQIIVPYTPGGSADLMSRTIAQRLGEAGGRLRAGGAGGHGRSVDIPTI